MKVQPVSLWHFATVVDIAADHHATDAATIGSGVVV
jgi:hypothetical protein